MLDSNTTPTEARTMATMWYKVRAVSPRYPYHVVAVTGARTPTLAEARKLRTRLRKAENEPKELRYEILRYSVEVVK
jgi:hypothetical protein